MINKAYEFPFYGECTLRITARQNPTQYCHIVTDSRELQLSNSLENYQIVSHYRPPQLSQDWKRPRLNKLLSSIVFIEADDLLG